MLNHGRECKHACNYCSEPVFLYSAISLSILVSNCDVHGGIYLSRALQSHVGDHVKEMGEYISAVPQYCTAEGFQVLVNPLWLCV